MVNDQPVNSSPVLLRQLGRFRPEREVGQIAGQHRHLGGVLRAQLLQGFCAAGDDDEVVGLVEEVVRDCEADAWRGGEWVSEMR